MEATGNTELQPSEREKHLAQLAQVLIDRFDAASINSNTDDEERSQLDDEHEVPEPVVAGGVLCDCHLRINGIDFNLQRVELLLKLSALGSMRAWMMMRI